MLAVEHLKFRGAVQCRVVHLDKLKPHTLASPDNSDAPPFARQSPKERVSPQGAAAGLW
jgi:hypothetical protein